MRPRSRGRGGAAAVLAGLCLLAGAPPRAGAGRVPRGAAEPRGLASASGAAAWGPGRAGEAALAPPGPRPGALPAEAEVREAEAQAVVEEHLCALCRDLAEEAGGGLRAGFARWGPALEGALDAGALERGRAAGLGPVEACRRAGACPQEWEVETVVPVSPLDLRVTRGYGPTGYDKVRVSVVSSNASALPGPRSNETFDYERPFQWRWKQNFLQSSLKSLEEGRNLLRLDGHNVTVDLPPRGAGTRGILIADPCIMGMSALCTHGDKWRTLETVTDILNAAAKDPRLSFWGILGDNFYDDDGDTTNLWFAQLTLQTKSKIMLSVVGNHDLWLFGNPALGRKKDQFGVGYLQWYMQDTASTLSFPRNGELFNFTNHPGKKASIWPWRHTENIPTVDNFFSYYTIGNIGFIGYSSHHSWEHTQPYLEEACAFLLEENRVGGLEVVFLMGHWNRCDSGCASDMDVPSVHARLWSSPEEMPTCNLLGNAVPVKYLAGHTHCNKILEPDVGFMLAGQGMAGCPDPNFGIPVLDTTGNRMKLLYYPLVEPADGGDFSRQEERTAAILDCFGEGDLGKCEHLAERWLDQPFRPPPKSAGGGL